MPKSVLFGIAVLCPYTPIIGAANVKIKWIFEKIFIFFPVNKKVHFFVNVKINQKQLL